MAFEIQFNQLEQISFPPEGAVNTRRGRPVEGPGGRWVPCATALEGGTFIACLFEVGAGRRQVCGDATPRLSETEALMRAADLAAIAAA
jgi:hypothetical protein